MPDSDRPAGLSEGERRGTYEVFAEVEHFQRHCEDWAEKLSRCWKLVDTGNPEQMVANALREWADELDPAAVSPVSVEGQPIGYREGFDAYHAGVGLNDNPMKRHPSIWAEGWIDAKRADEAPVSVEGEGDVPDGLNLYLCRDCESWSSLACHDQQHHQRSFRSVRFVPVAADEGQLGGVEGEWTPGRWWRVLDPDGEVWDETSREAEAREVMRPGDRLQRLWERRATEWRDA